MQKNQVLSLTGLAMAMAALIATHAAGRLRSAEPLRLPVANFPRQVGVWKAGPDQPIAPEVKKQLSTADIIERVYVNPAGQSIDLLLVTAASANDLHNPQICLPDQGWALQDEKTVRIGDDEAHSMVASNGLQQLDLVYWLTAKTVSHRSLPGTLQAFRAWFAGVEGHTVTAGLEGDSLLVRLMAPHSKANHAALLAFAQEIQKPLAPLQAMAHRSGRS